MRYYSARFSFLAKRPRLVTDLKVNWEIDTLYIKEAIAAYPYRKDTVKDLWENLFEDNTTDMKQNLRKLAGAAGGGFWAAKYKRGFLGYTWQAEERRLGDLSRLEVFDDLVELEEISAVCGQWSRKRRLLGFRDAAGRNRGFTKKDAIWLEKGINQNRGSKKVVVRVYNHVGASVCTSLISLRYSD